MSDLTNLTTPELRYRIAGITDWDNTREVSARILGMSDEEFAEAERRDADLAALRAAMRSHPVNSPEWRNAVDAYTKRFTAWITGR